jgi:hypothetical protein
LTQSLQDGFLPSAQLIEVDFGLAEFDPASGGVLGFSENLCGVQQCLGRNAAAVETNSPEPRILFDQDYLFAFVGGVKSGSVTAGPGAEDDNLGFNRFHRLTSV